MRHRTLTIAALTLLAARAAAAQPPRDLAPYRIADRAEEIELARTGAPRHVSDSATVLVLGTAGYVEAVRGTNGFTCVVIRSFGGSTSDPAFWNPKVRAPHCFNPPAVRTVLAPMLERATWIIAGVGLAEVDARTKRAYASRVFVAPAPGAMAYMTSPRQYLLDDDPRWLPHLMFYHDRATSGATFGAAGMTAPVIDASASDANAFVLTLLVPVRQWSDGSAAPPLTASR
ncbi:MAG TPA: hypothetical protein VFS59_12730 [Gemmatimonadaceae bacterium]|nr:hypothetical protein [Gemmatimonadaceae bacterium]